MPVNRAVLVEHILECYESPSAESSKYRVGIFRVDVGVLTWSITACVVAQISPLAALVNEEEVNYALLRAVASL
jgi:hypothetical protein